MDRSQFTIAAAQVVDGPALRSLLGELFTLEQDFLPDAARQAAGLTQLLADRQRGAIVVARDPAGSVIGMVSGQLVISTAEGAYSVWVEDLIVQAAWRGRGVGAALLAGVLQWAQERGATRAQLLVDDANAPALAFYAHQGWQTTHLVARRLMLRRA